MTFKDPMSLEVLISSNDVLLKAEKGSEDSTMPAIIIHKTEYATI